MAETPESLVYRGREGTGAAQIFGREGNPLRAFRERKADIDNKRRMQAEQARLQREQRDKDLWELTNVNPDKAFEPFDSEVKKAAEAHRKEIYNKIMEAGGATPAVKLFAKNGWDKVNNLAAKSQYIKGIVADTQKSIQDDPYLDYTYYFPKINDSYLNPDGTAKPLDQINADQIRDISVNDPMGFNAAKYQKDYFDGLNENMNNYIRQRAANNGILTEDVENRWKGNLYIRDPQSPIGVKTDANGQPLINMTPDLVNSFLNTEKAQRYYGALAAQQGLPVQEVLTQALKPYTGIQTNVRPSFDRDQSWYFNRMNTGLKPEESQMANKLWENVGAEVNAFINSDGTRRKEASPEARAAAGHMIGSKAGNGTIKEVDFIPGTNKPGRTTIFGKSIDNSPNDRMVRKIQMSNGSTKLDEIDLTDEGAGTSLWTLHKNAGYFGKADVSFDQAAQELNFDPKSLYSGREYVGKNRETEQRNINAWTEGNDFQAMKGRSINGMQITDVEQVNERSLRHPITGVFKGYKLTLEDGSTVEIPKDDYETFTDIYRSGTAEPAAAPDSKGSKKLKSSYKLNGKSITLKELQEAGYNDDQIREAIELGNLE